MWPKYADNVTYGVSKFPYYFQRAVAGQLDDSTTPIFFDPNEMAVFAQANVYHLSIY